MHIEISDGDLISEMVSSGDERTLLDFISYLADYASGYYPEFQTRVIERMEADR